MSQRPQPPAGPPPSRRGGPAPPSGPPPSQRSRPSAPSSNRRKERAKLRRSDSESTGDSFRQNSKEFNDSDKRAFHKKGRPKKGMEVPTKDNNYLDMRMSEVLRGDEKHHFDVHAILYDDEDFDENEPDFFLSKIVYKFKKKATERKFAARALLCATAVVLLWISSAAACRALVSAFIPPPSVTELVSLVNNSVTEANELKSSYVDGVLDAVEECRNKTPDSFNKSQAKLKVVQDANTEVIETADSRRKQCASDLEEMLVKLDDYINDVNFNLGTFLVSPAPEECADFNSIVGSQVSTGQLVSAADASASGSNDAVDSFESQLAEREAYDAEYFNNITTLLGANDAIESLYNSDDLSADFRQQQLILRACTSPTAQVVEDGEVIAVCPEGQRIGVTVAQTLAEYEAEIEALNSTVQGYIETVEGYADDIDRLRQFAAILDSGGIDLLNAPPLDLEGLKLAMTVGLGELGVSQEEIDAYIAAREAELEAEIQKAEARLDQVEQELREDQEEFLNNLTSEFAPPGGSVDSEASKNASRAAADELRNQVASDLEGVDGDIEGIEEGADFEVIVNSTSIEYIVGIQNRAVDFFAYDQQFFVNFENNLDRLVDLLVTFDVVFRVLQSILVVKKYWSVSAIALPPADCRSDKGMLFKEKLTPIQLLAKFLSSPGVAMLAILVVVTTLTLLFYAAYVPLFSEYVSGCIDNGVLELRRGEADGTMLFRNLNTTLFNFVASEGDAARTKDLDKLNVERQLICSEMLQDSVNVRQSQIDAHRDLVQKFNRLTNRYVLFDTCVDWASLDSSIASASVAPFNIIPDPGFDFNQRFKEPLCRAPVPDIVVNDSALHSCDEVPICEVDLSVDSGGVELLALNSACEGEYAFHSYFLLALFVSTMYTCLNLARFYFLRGIIGVGWRTLCLDVYSYMVSCTERGTILPPKEVEEGEPFQEVIRKALAKALKKFTLMGYLDLFFSLSINLPWIVFMIVFSKNITYDSVSG